MKRTVSLKLVTIQDNALALSETQELFAVACNHIVPFAVDNRCWNRVALHHLSYFPVREFCPDIGSQMACNAIHKVCASYKVLNIAKDQPVPTIKFRSQGSVHYDKRTYSLKGSVLSLFTVRGRIRCSFRTGVYQKKYLEIGISKEGELVRRGKHWYFNLVLEIPDTPAVVEGKIFAVDMGENNLATTSEGTIYGGGQLRHKRDKFLARRRKLQSNGSPSAMRCFKRISGREHRHVQETNHIVSKAIVEEASQFGARIIVLEDLTNIRKRIKGNKRMRSRLHRWGWKELQMFVEYKAQARGIKVLHVNPAYSSQKCSLCRCLGFRKRNQFKCPSCGNYQHSDRNAAINLLRFGESVVSSTAYVNMPMVEALATSFSL